MRATHPLKSKTTSIRFDTDLKKPINDWLLYNPDFNVSRLVNMAIRRFISEKQTLKSVKTVKANDAKVKKVAQQMMKKHSHMLEKLK